MSHHHAQLALESPEETCRFAKAVGKNLGAGDVILLAGDVGAGKTHFARCLIQSLLSAPEDIPSPTYTLVQMYTAPAGEIWHADLYRLTDISEIDELGLSQAFSDAICLVEWPDRLGDQIPDDALTLVLDAPDGGDKRYANLSWTDPSWGEKLQQVLNV